MKIFSINNNTPYRSVQKPHHSAPNFKSIRVSPNVRKQASENLGTLSSLFITRLKEALSKPSYFKAHEEETVSNFIKLKKHDANVARLFLESGRRLTQETCMNVMYDKKLNAKELKAFEFLLNLKSGKNTDQHAFVTFKLGHYFNDAPEYEIDAINASAEKITRILEGWETFEVRKMDTESLVAMALILQNSKTFTEEEMKRYLHANLGFFEVNMQDWNNGDVEIRNQILTEVENASPLLKQIIEDSYELYEVSLHPNENLLNKIRLINQEPDLEGIRDILEESCYAEDLKTNLEKYKKLPQEKKNIIKNSLIASLIVNFENYKYEGVIKNLDVTPDDYVTLAQILPESNTLYDSQELLSIPHITEDKKNLLESNKAIFNKLETPLGSVSKPIYKILFSEDFANNVTLLKELIDRHFEDILHDVYLKTQNFNPEFSKIAEDFLSNLENLYSISTLPNFTKKDIVENMYHLAKIQALTMNNPERFMNYDENEVSKKDIEKLKEISNLILHSEDDYIDNEGNIPISISEPFFDLCGFFNDDELLNLYTAITNTDAEYANMILSRRTEYASEAFKKIAEWNYETGALTSNILRNGKTLDPKDIPIKLSGKQKTFLVTNIPEMRETLKTKFDEILAQNKTPLKNGEFILDYDSFLDDYGATILTELGISPNSEKASLWDKSFLHHILNQSNRGHGELKLVFDLLSNGELENYIHNPFTPHGKSNLKTKQEFEKLNLDYQIWQKGIPPQKIKIGNKYYTIGILDKNTPNTLFMGNYTNCCTAIERMYGESTPSYILNTTFSILGFKNSDGKIAGMVRIFINNDNGKPELIIDNTELDTILLNQDKYKIEKHIIRYLKEFSKSLTPKELPILISQEVFKISPKGEAITKLIKPIGEITKNVLYINSAHKSVETKTPYYVDMIKLDI